MSVSTTDALVDRVAEIGPIIREHADAAEAGRRLPAQVMDALCGAGLFRMLLPRPLGGLEADPVTFARTVEAVARHDSAAAWVLQAASFGDWWGARLPDEGVEEIFGDDPDTMVAAAFHPPSRGRRRTAATGSRASGRWRAPSGTRTGSS